MTLELAIAAIDKEFGKGSIVRLGDASAEPWPAIPTGALNLDVILGIGGLPRGRIVEIYGPESVGKSTIALSVVAEAQQMGITCAYIDVENALDPGYMRRLGINMDELLLSQPDTGEDALGIVDRLVDTGEVGVIVVDSVAALTPRAEIEGDMGQSHVGLQARLMSHALRKLTHSLAKEKVLLIFINQLRDRVGIMYGNPEITTGGKALKFYASVRLDMRRKEDLKKDGEANGVKVRIRTVKNKMAPALREAEVDIIYGVGINKVGCIIDLAIERGIIKRSGAWFTLPNSEEAIQGKDKLNLYLSAHPQQLEVVKEQVLQ